MNTENQVSPPPRASHDQVFSFAARVATKVNSWGLRPEQIQSAMDRSDDDPHPVWVAMRNALAPQPDALAQQVMREEVTRPRIEVLSERPKSCAKRTVDEQVAGLKRMYAELRWTWTESGLIPQRQKGIDRLLAFTDTSFTNNRVFDVCKASFPSWRYADDLDSAIPVATDERHPSRGPYFIWVKDEVGPDRDLMGLPADTIARRRLKTETTLEYMFHHLIHLWETGEHLDPRTGTLCCGSRASGGSVPFADWLVDEFGVDRCNPDDRNPHIGARQAVTL